MTGPGSPCPAQSTFLHTQEITGLLVLPSSSSCDRVTHLEAWEQGSFTPRQMPFPLSRLPLWAAHTVLFYDQNFRVLTHWFWISLVKISHLFSSLLSLYVGDEKILALPTLYKLWSPPPPSYSPGRHRVHGAVHAFVDYCVVSACLSGACTSPLKPVVGPAGISTAHA